MQRSLSLQIILPLVSFDSFPPHCTHPSINPVSLTWSHDNQCWSLAASLRTLCSALTIRYKICTHTFQRKGVAAHYPSTRQPVNPSTRQPVNPSTRQPVNPSTRQPVNPSTRQPVNPSTRQPVNPSTRQPRGKGERGQEEKNMSLFFIVLLVLSFPFVWGWVGKKCLIFL